MCIFFQIERPFFRFFCIELKNYGDHTKFAGFLGIFCQSPVNAKMRLSIINCFRNELCAMIMSSEICNTNAQMAAKRVWCTDGCEGSWRRSASHIHWHLLYAVCYMQLCWPERQFCIISETHVAFNHARKSSFNGEKGILCSHSKGDAEEAEQEELG